ncbi:MAG: TIGR04255 family protein [Alcaligenaceae bacterium]|nr:TIGR04255 family protein [Alcaligenaceae bacterium]
MHQAKPLPTRLHSEPLIDAIFEMHFTGASAAQILPGYLFSRLEGDKHIEPLAIGSIPAEVRRQDQGLADQPTLRMLWDRYILIFGDSIFGVACRLPYPGWQAFRSNIMSLAAHVIESGVVTQVSRFNLRYLDLIDGEQPAELNENLDMELALGGTSLKDNPFQFQSIIELGGFVHRVALTSPAEMIVGEARAHRRGLLISVDTPIEQPCEAVAFVGMLDSQLDQVHTANKKTFFACLTEAAVQAMGPKYDQQ